MELYYVHVGPFTPALKRKGFCYIIFSYSEPPPALHYSLNLHSSACPNEERTKKAAISGSLLKHFEALVEQVKPEEVANKLYGIAVLDQSEVDQASDVTEPVEERARVLMQLLKKKLCQNPGWFVDVSKVLRACGVKAISEVIGTNAVLVCRNSL